MLVDEGFKVVSVDASDKMLKYALKARWENRKNPNYDQWGMYYIYVYYMYFTTSNLYLNLIIYFYFSKIITFT